MDAVTVEAVAEEHGAVMQVQLAVQVEYREAVEAAEVPHKPEQVVTVDLAAEAK